MRTIFLLLACLTWIGPHAASARDFYWIDQVIADCGSGSDPHEALAVTSTGTWGCVTTASAPDRQKEEALALCTSYLTAIERSKKVPCQVVWEDGRIVDKALYKAMSSEFRTPVVIESHNGDTGETSKFNGYLVAGKSRMDGDDYLSVASVLLEDGTEICRGVSKDTASRSVQILSVICFDNLRLTGKLKIKGLVKVDGYYRFARFQVKVENPPHWMNVVSR